MSEGNDISNRGLGKLLSIELFISLLGGATVIGITYGMLSSDILANEKRVTKVEQQQRELTKDIQQIKTDTAIMRNEQSHMKNNINQILYLLRSFPSKSKLSTDK